MLKTVRTISCSLFFLCFVSVNAYGMSNFISIGLSGGISLDIPRNWAILSRDQRITLDTLIESKLDLSNLEATASNLNFVAYYADADGEKTNVNLRYYPDSEVTQNFARKATPKVIKLLDDTMRKSITNSAKANNQKILNWGGTHKQEFGEFTAFVTAYRRPAQMGQAGSFSVRLIRIFDGQRSFTLTVSYNDLYKIIYQPICDRIIKSLTITK